MNEDGDKTKAAMQDLEDQGKKPGGFFVKDMLKAQIVYLQKDVDKMLECLRSFSEIPDFKISNM